MPKFNCLGFFESEIRSFYISANYKSLSVIIGKYMSLKSIFLCIYL